MPDAFTTIHRKAIIALGAQHCFPAIYPYRYEVVDGGLMAYGVDTVDLLRKQGFAPEDMEPDQFGAFIKSEIARWSAVVSDANIKE